ncbi:MULTISPECIES: peptide chain release factor N(5)-glutamine methyltransferase [unclassified Paenibacillus]|uniref:peptide chain release factor N(5)-glutamine methyltransferase n=1 Tax=unclassified Paenibacillus TaxID=185978 RepID=UPI00070FBB5E|nr:MULTISPECIES: peptide chain release factor N(5)-glutamine methyltransferase [unclassified Paenibacillus]KQX60145.1 protein-(glutamine-N5) methyltransferase, release factor-specific [Paenibacillus sp. Root444D2]KRE41766.1 protein-(glutamine-N5) methyltransferase, release factor-specific [Paenibacillus sp. Soil724D2]
MSTAAKSLREAFVEASSFLGKLGVAEAASCVELLLQHLLGCSRTELLFRFPEQFPAELAETWRQLVERKAAGEPVQYIIGEQDFFGLPFAVSPDVLIPRPETELLVEALLHEGSRLFPQGTPLLADVGTGSGAIPVTVAHARPTWRVAASDISAAALEMARVNAQRHGVAARVEWLEGDLLEPFIARRIAPDILVSNPPYIPDGDLPALQPEVRLFEPHTALFGGVEGLDLYRRMISQLPQLPRIPTVVGFEVGIRQAEAVAAMLRAAADWDEIRFVPDLQGIDRHVIAIRSRD